MIMNKSMDQYYSIYERIHHFKNTNHAHTTCKYSLSGDI